jgi:predicted DNA-binding transcriptional regulator AlpA
MAKTNILPQGITPVVLNLRQAAAYCNVAVNSFYKLVEAGRLPRGRPLLGQRSVWLIADLDAALAALPRAGDAPEPAPQDWD